MLMSTHACLVFPELAAGVPYPHLAIPALAGYLEHEAGLAVEAVDLAAPGSRIPWASLEEAGFVGFSIAYPQQIDGAVRLARALRERGCGAALVAGGATITARVDAIRNDSRMAVFDGLVAGDGEEPLREMLQRVARGERSLDGVPNCHVRAAGGFRPPDRQYAIVPSEYRVPRFAEGAHERLPLRLGKGCYWRRCAFCTYKSIFDGFERPDVDNVVDQIVTLYERHGTTRFVLVDDAVPARTLARLAERLSATGAPVRFECSATFDGKFADPAVAATLAEGGCHRIYFGFESANPRVLALMGKMNDPDKVRKILRSLTRAGIRCHLNVMIGFPTETVAEAEETIEFLRRNRDIYDSFHAQLFSLEEDCEVFRESERFGIRGVRRPDASSAGRRTGYEFECFRGMDPVQRQYMALKCQLAYRREGVSRIRHLKERLELVSFLVRNPGLVPAGNRS